MLKKHLARIQASLPQITKFLIACCVIVTMIYLMLTPAFSAVSITIVAFQILILAIVATAITIKKKGLNPKGWFARRNAVPPAPGTDPANPQPPAPAKTKDESRTFGWYYWRAVGTFAVLIFLTYISMGIVTVLTVPNPKAVAIEKQNAEQYRRPVEVHYPTMAEMSESVTVVPNFRTIILPQGKETPIPKATDPSKLWRIRTRNTTDTFIVRCKKHDVEIGQATFRGEMDRNVKLPIDADDYTITCTNADTEVVWTQVPKTMSF